jgi:hypothetical protein
MRPSFLPPADPTTNGAVIDAARVLIRQQGDEAASIAIDRACDAAERGDEVQADLWADVARAIRREGLRPGR